MTAHGKNAQELAALLNGGSHVALSKLLRKRGPHKTAHKKAGVFEKFLQAELSAGIGKKGVSALRGSSGGGSAESAIDGMVAAALVRGRQTSGVLNALFGLSPALSGR